MSDRISRLFVFLLILLPAAVFAQDSIYRFSIPQGSLKAALSSFETTTGLSVSVIDGIDLANFRSPGLTGEMDASAALDTLLAGTGLSTRREATGFTVRIAAPPVRVEVEGKLTSYRALDGTKLSPMALAPRSTAASASSTLVTPQILTCISRRDRAAL